MGGIKRFCAEKLIFGVLFCDKTELEQVKKLLENEFGPVDLESRVFDFNYSAYYNSEMGERIFRVFLSFEKLVDPGRLAQIKHLSNSFEEQFCGSSGRRINLDPGLLSLSRLMLASTKNNAHRVPLADGIYAEITLLYHKGAYSGFPWTYPDFSSGDYDPDLLAFRQKYARQLKQQQ